MSIGSPELILVLGCQPAGDPSYKPGCRLPLLSDRPAVTFAAADNHHPLVDTITKLYCMVAEARWCEQLANSSYAAMPRWGVEPGTISFM